MQAAIPLAVADFQSQAEAIVDQVIEDIPEDYSELSNRVTELYDTLAGILRRDTFTFDWEQGFISDVTGADSPSYADKYIRTDGYYKFACGIHFEVPEGMSVIAYKYTSPSYSDFTTRTVYTDPEVTIIDNENYYRFCYHNTDSSDITTTDAGDVDVWQFYLTDDTLTMHGVAADAYTVGSYLLDPTNITIMWAQGSYNSSTGAAQTSLTNRVRSLYFVPFKQYIKITVPAGWKMYWYRYTTWEYTSFTGNSGGWLTGTFTLKNDAKYKFSIAKTDDSAIIPADVEALNIVMEVGHPDNVLHKTTTDATKELQAMLGSYREVLIDEGTYNITDTIKMTPNQVLYGTGFGTILRLDDSVTNKPTILMASGCTVRDMQLKGRATDYVLEDDEHPENVVPASNGGRHGIEITGEIKRGCIDNVWIHGFSGFGCYMHDNSYSSNQGFSVVNSYFTNNHCGMKTITAEFMRINCCDFNQNYIGLYNLGGNNNITNCNMSSNYYGISFDNSNEDGTNNTHGSIANCSVQHSRTAGIYMNNVAAGEVFTGMNIGTSGIVLVDTYRVIFDACNFMNDAAVNITGGGLTMFVNCNMRSYMETDSSITGNSYVKFINCFTSNGQTIDPTT